MTCPKCNGVALIRVLRTVTKLYGMPRQMTFTRPCPRCDGTGQAKPLPPMWWQDKDDDQPAGKPAEM